MKAVVLDSMPIIYGGLDFNQFKSLCDIECFERTDDNDFDERARHANVILTNKVHLNKERIERLPELKYIGVLATGFDVVDIDYAREKGIIVTNIPSYSSHATAQHTFALLLLHMNQLSVHTHSLRQGQWQSSSVFSYFLSPLHELKDKTIGLIGYGAIAKQVAKIANAFEMNVLAHTRTPQSDNSVTFVSRDELFKQSDIVSLHCPLTAATKTLVNEQTLSLMKQHAILINAARGGLVDEHALAAALKNKRISHALLDVLSREPPAQDNPLLNLKNATITPHIAWGSVEARKRLIQIAYDNLQAFIKGSPINRVNPT